MEPTNILPLLDELDEKASQATRRPWIPLAHYDGNVGTIDADPISSKEDTDFIVSVINAYPQLASELRRAMTCIKELGDLHIPGDTDYQAKRNDILRKNGFADGEIALS